MGWGDWFRFSHDRKGKTAFQCQRQWEKGFPSPRKRQRRNTNSRSKKATEAKSSEEASRLLIPPPRGGTATVLDDSSSSSSFSSVGDRLPQQKGFGPVKRRRWLRQLLETADRNSGELQDALAVSSGAAAEEETADVWERLIRSPPASKDGRRRQRRKSLLWEEDMEEDDAEMLLDQNSVKGRMNEQSRHSSFLLWFIFPSLPLPVFRHTADFSPVNRDHLDLYVRRLKRKKPGNAAKSNKDEASDRSSVEDQSPLCCFAEHLQSKVDSSEEGSQMDIWERLDNHRRQLEFQEDQKFFRDLSSEDDEEGMADLEDWDDEVDPDDDSVQPRTHTFLL